MKILMITEDENFISKVFDKEILLNKSCRFELFVLNMEDCKYRKYRHSDFDKVYIDQNIACELIKANFEMNGLMDDMFKYFKNPLGVIPDSKIRII